MGELSKLPNIGKIVEEQLMQVGIHTAAEFHGDDQRYFELIGILRFVFIKGLCGDVTCFASRVQRRESGDKTVDLDNSDCLCHGNLSFLDLGFTY